MDKDTVYLNKEDLDNLTISNQPSTLNKSTTPNKLTTPNKSTIPNKSIKDEIFNTSLDNLNKILNSWVDDKKTGGALREDRGTQTEKFVRDTIDLIGKKFDKKLFAKIGSNDKKKLQIKIKEEIIQKEHQVDVHIYLDDKFISIIEFTNYFIAFFYFIVQS
jgi:hypothetical protein